MTGKAIPLGLFIGSIVILGLLATFGLTESSVQVAAGAAGKAAADAAARNRSYVQAAITMVLLFASLFVILSRKYDEAEKKWAYGTVGTIIGFWLGSAADGVP